MEKLGYEVSPKAEEPRYDIIQTIAFGAPDPLRRFCEGIQAGAPVDSYVTPGAVGNAGLRRSGYPWCRRVRAGRVH